jgi:putative transposase
MSNLTLLSQAQRQYALAQFHLLKPPLEGDIPFTQVAHKAGIPYRTAQRWLAQS